MGTDAVLVTGGAGFIGSHLVERLVRGGRRVRVLDNFTTGRKENLRAVQSQIELRRGDIRNLTAVRRAVKGVEQVYHLAAVSSVPLSVDDPLTTAHVNVTGTWNVLEAAREFAVRRVVFVSSASVYGAEAPVPFTESMRLRGSSPYAASKLMGEQLCRLYGDLYGLETVALRLFSVYGPRQNPHSHYANVIPAFATRVLNGEQPTIYGNGKQTRDFVFVEDVVRAFLLAGRRRKVINEIINFGSGRQLSVNELLRRIQRELGSDLAPRYAPRKPGDDPRTCADTRKYRSLLGIKKLTPFSTGLARTLKWFRRAT